MLKMDAISFSSFGARYVNIFFLALTSEGRIYYKPNVISHGGRV
jgi:hypothetical protein